MLYIWNILTMYMYKKTPGGLLSPNTQCMSYHELCKILPTFPKFDYLMCTWNCSIIMSPIKFTIYSVIYVYILYRYNIYIKLHHFYY